MNQIMAPDPISRWLSRCLTKSRDVSLQSEQLVSSAKVPDFSLFFSFFFLFSADIIFAVRIFFRGLSIFIFAEIREFAEKWEPCMNKKANRIDISAFAGT